MPELIIKRSREWVNKARGIDIFVDGNKIGNIYDGEDKQIQVTAGVHTVKTKIDWCGSPEVSLNFTEGEPKVLALESFAKSWNFPRFVFSFFLIATVGSVVLHGMIAFWLGIPVMLVIIYYLSIRRNKYLVLKVEGEN